MEVYRIYYSSIKGEACSSLHLSKSVERKLCTTRFLFISPCFVLIHVKSWCAAAHFGKNTSKQTWNFLFDKKTIFEQNNWQIKCSVNIELHPIWSTSLTLMSELQVQYLNQPEAWDEPDLLVPSDLTGPECIRLIHWFPRLYSWGTKKYLQGGCAICTPLSPTRNQHSKVVHFEQNPSCHTMLHQAKIFLPNKNKIEPHFHWKSELGNSFGPHPNGTNFTKWNFYTLFHNNLHMSTERIA